MTKLNKVVPFVLIMAFAFTFMVHVFPVSAEDSKPVLLVVSFGTSYNDSRDLTIGGIEKALEAEFPEYEIRRAFTSQIIIDKLAERDGLKIDNVTEAMGRLVADGVKDVVIQSTHIMSGYEYDDTVAEVTPFKDLFNSFKMGKPLLTSDADFDKVVSIITEETEAYDEEGTAIVFMGHGTEHKSNAVYAEVQRRLTDAGHANYFVGTVEGTPTVDDVLEAVEKIDVKKVVLLPFMIVAGDHANNDMAGDEPDSWKTIFEEAGYEMESLIQGLGQSPDIQQLIIEHAHDAIDGPEFGAETAEGAASGPILADALADGTYPIDVTSSSSMFNIVDAQLIVKDGAMTCVITMSGQGYGKLFMGTGEEALAAPEDSSIPFVLNAAGEKTFIVPVAALNQDIDCAAWSLNKEEWYDRVLVFKSDKLPAEAYK